MKPRFLILVFLILWNVMISHGSEHVILLHGLCRTTASMKPLEASIAAAGFRVINTGYPSRTAAIAELAEACIGKAVARSQDEGATTVHFVTHSLGGILVRSYLARNSIPTLGRVVMLGPPNRGSEVVDRLGRLWLFGTLNGPAGRELGTGLDATPNKLGPATFPLGIIAGDRSINWINSLMIPGPDDGKVSVQNTKLEGMADHLVIHTTHPLMMRNKEVQRQTVQFLQQGCFAR